MRADVFAENLAVFGNFHNSTRELETAYTDYRIYTVFFACVFPALVRVLNRYERAH